MDWDVSVSRTAEFILCSQRSPKVVRGVVGFFWCLRWARSAEWSAIWLPLSVWPGMWDGQFQMEAVIMGKVIKGRLDVGDFMIVFCFWSQVVKARARIISLFSVPPFGPVDNWFVRSLLQPSICGKWQFMAPMGSPHTQRNTRFLPPLPAPTPCDETLPGPIAKASFCIS